MANTHETKPLGSDLNPFKEGSGFPYLPLKEHAIAGKYFLYNDKQIQGQECSWGMMTSGLMIQFTLGAAA